MVTPPIINPEPEEADLLADQIRAGVNEDQTNFTNPIPSITEATQMGEVTVSFSEPLKAIPPSIDITKLKYDKKRNLLEEKPRW